MENIQYTASEREAQIQKRKDRFRGEQEDEKNTSVASKTLFGGI